MDKLNKNMKSPRVMMFYFMMCSWLDEEKPNGYTHYFMEKLWVRNQIYWYAADIAYCLDY